VRILLHLVSKVDRTQLDYRPTPNQRSTIELLRYLSMMGPTLVQFALAEPRDFGIWTAAVQAADARDFDGTIAAIEAQHDGYERLLANVPDAEFRVEMTGFDGKKTSRGAFIVNLVLCGCAAYRTQLFGYLKACGRQELGTTNLWAGVDAAARV
jgi:hypothetical protein